MKQGLLTAITNVPGSTCGIDCRYECALRGCGSKRPAATAGLMNGTIRGSVRKTALAPPIKPLHTPLTICLGQQTNSTPEKSEMPQGSSMAKLRICMLRSWQAAAPVWFHLTNGQHRDALWM
uniref:Uncharacterized protein n=1 Tax=Anopheles coluzzii TaxID=1518534 RepID=A0A8W7PR41_ANOCL